MADNNLSRTAVTKVVLAVDNVHAALVYALANVDSSFTEAVIDGEVDEGLACEQQAILRAALGKALHELAPALALRPALACHIPD